MLFNSWEFLWFLAVVLPLYFVLKTRAQNAMLLVASYFFYGWWDWRFLLLLWISTGIDFFVARSIAAAGENVRRRRRLLFLSLATNLGILCLFKYTNFFIESASALLDTLGVPFTPVVLQVVLPIGISFYTFQTLAYTIDVYRGKFEPTNDFVTFALYVAFFPQLVAGPIERPQHLLPALAAPRSVRGRQIISGLALILVGLVRKVAIADFLAGTVDETFASPASFSSLRLLVGVYAFAIQIYMDFAGYSDIARGTARLLGIDLMVNFRRPYSAWNLTNFWRRWHISLSTWLRDYSYISLGGNRFGGWLTLRNLMITMLLGGLWHGASWNFVIWGGLHGVYLVAHRGLCRLRGISRHGTPPPGVRGVVVRSFSMLLTFHLVCLAWVFFRAETLGQSLDYLHHLSMCSSGTKLADYMALHRTVMALAMLCIIDGAKAFAERRGFDFASLSPLLQGAFLGLMLMILLVFGDRVNVPFLYFQF